MIARGTLLISSLLIGSNACANDRFSGAERPAKRAVITTEDGEVLSDNRIDLRQLIRQPGSPSFSLRSSRKKKTKSASRRDSPKITQRGLNPIFSDADFFKVDFIKKETVSDIAQIGPTCPVPVPVDNGYSGDRRRGYRKVANGVFCNRGASDGSRCFLMCQRGSRLVTSSATKKFKCKCQNGVCEWSTPIEEVSCQERGMRRKARKFQMQDFEI